jgi:hypothetical protein
MKNVHDKNEYDKELEDIAPSLAKFISKKRPDDIPFRYFDKLPDRVLDQIEIHTGKQITWWDRLAELFITRKPLVLALASLVGLVIIAGIFFYKPASHVLDLSKLDADEVKTYLLSQAADLEDEQLSMLHTNDNRLDMLHISNEELGPILDEYLDQINNEELN